MGCRRPSLVTVCIRMRRNRVLTERLQALQAQSMLKAGAALGRDKNLGSLRQWTLQGAGIAKVVAAMYHH